MSNSKSIIEVGFSFQTTELKELYNWELYVEFLPENKLDVFNLLSFVDTYIKNDNPKIHDNETIQYGFWILKFILKEDKMELWEISLDLKEFQHGVKIAASLYKEQKKLLEDYRAVAQVPNFDQKIVISDGVYEGDSVEGVRYPSPKHMCGWWITTDRYNGDINSLKTVPLWDFIPYRPDLIKFLVLPDGYRFHTYDNIEVWLDKTVLS